ncbi:MAG TPA: hypothetical protein VFE36_03500 [Candidatus Baltobacteraceae bacterium]|nr:hypothetical protein [Candidatus Baltobacteraceae bacterium]
MADALSFAKDIRPMFTDTDVDHMSFAMDLSDAADVAKNADAILAVVKDGSMPPARSGGVRWTDEMCDKFESWINQGCLP